MKGSITAAMMMYLMMNQEAPRVVNNRVERNNPPWYTIQLPKTQRKLPYEERQELKKQIWVEQNPARTQEPNK